MVSRTILSAIGITVWAAVLVTAAPRALSHRHGEHSSFAPVHEQWPAASCSDLHFEFDGRDALTQSEEKTISKAEAPTLRVQAESNGGLQVQGWDQNTYSVTLCKGARSGSDAASVTPHFFSWSWISSWTSMSAQPGMPIAVRAKH